MLATFYRQGENLGYLEGLKSLELVPFLSNI